MKMFLAFLAQLVQIKVSFIGFNKNAIVVLGKQTGTQYKVAEISAAVLTFGIRLTVRV